MAVIATDLMPGRKRLGATFNPKAPCRAGLGERTAPIVGPVTGRAIGAVSFGGLAMSAFADPGLADRM